MKALIAGDYHDKPVKGDLDRLVELEKPTHLISLGDYDIIKSIEEFVKIAKYCRRKGIVVIDVPGNHDHAVLHKINVRSPTLARSGSNILELNEELEDNKTAKKYLENITQLENIEKHLQIGKFSIAIVHGAYCGDISSLAGFFWDERFRDEKTHCMWYRLVCEASIRVNFEEMKKRNENLMIRGHDHMPLHGQLKKGCVSYDYLSYGGTVNLGPRSLHVISPGAFCEGHYAILEETKKAQLKVRYRKFY